MYEQFVNKVQHKHPLYLICIPILIVAISLLLIATIWDLFTTLLLDHFIDTERDFGLAMTLEMILTLFTTLWLIKKVSGFSYRDLGFMKRNFMKHYLLGAVGGALGISLVFFINLVFKGIDVTFVFKTEALSAILLAFIFFLFQGMYEELLFRLYLMPHFSKAWGHTFALITTSLLFMLLHGLNSSVNPLAFLNLFIFGMVFGLIYYRTGSAWLIGAGHSLWNFVLGPVLGSHVSGAVIDNTILLSTPTPHHFLLSGGMYGMEGSVLTTIVGLAVILYFLFSPKFKRATSRTTNPFRGSSLH
ncbi:CPBP family intramembrane glutamic endopeptidase [Staphylococcus lutrae]|uniref:CAAX prenyl protease 2/Lysostaphin resistance protein A-like domain-containing protein n=1 Tax=Staphylococcus lutrae TaxID=155085 RepID=A0AAC9RSP5_9STAP|nr:type II CAAX endopeptidase family protein [Staphylococcus lutrae]ARJ50974.1 hypothetical protein B5P37_06395 [Staphylococcus lutrae]PNZ38535.1 CPBP family intramembrane metalloprotease [Staphylococcus lutrae]